MMSKIYKPTIFVLMAFLAVSTMCTAQDTTIAKPGKQRGFNEKEFEFNMDNLGKNLSVRLNNITTKISVKLNDLNESFDLNIDSNVHLAFKDLGTAFSYNYSYDDQDKKDKSTQVKEKFKSYTKSYPLDANDKIKLSNQYGRITVNTWERHEIKVDVQIKAQAEDDETAQKLLDGVQVRDSKNGGLVTFRTSIEPNNNGSWKIWNWGNKKSHKIEINYIVYMPSKTDLNVEDSYGSIELPDLSGRVNIRSSYGSVSAQNLSNPADEIAGSYGSLKAGLFNGGRLDYSYGSVDLGECTNLKADLSYGSFKLGKLKGAADFDLSYIGGFKIEEMGGSFKRLNVNASYSGVSLGVPDNNNFNFDITTTYGGFNYNDDKVTITSKTPADGSKHYSSTKNYKGHYGKGGSEAQINIHSTYGSVRFE